MSKEWGKKCYQEEQGKGGMGEGQKEQDQKDSQEQDGKKKLRGVTNDEDQLATNRGSGMVEKEYRGRWRGSVNTQIWWQLEYELNIYIGRKLISTTKLLLKLHTDQIKKSEQHKNS